VSGHSDWRLDPRPRLGSSRLGMRARDNGPIAQRSEPPAHNRPVPGSNPGGPTNLRSHSMRRLPAVAQSAEAGLPASPRELRLASRSLRRASAGKPASRAFGRRLSAIASRQRTKSASEGGPRRTVELVDSPHPPISQEPTVITAGPHHGSSLLLNSSPVHTGLFFGRPLPDPWPLPPGHCSYGFAAHCRLPTAHCSYAS